MVPLQPRSYGPITCFCKAQADTVCHVALTANTESHALVVPTAANAVFFSVSPASTDYYVKIGGTAAIPTVNVLDGSGSEHNPIDGRFCVPGETISVISPAACVVTACFYK